jgi:hypothetical protein
MWLIGPLVAWASKDAFRPDSPGWNLYPPERIVASIVILIFCAVLITARIFLIFSRLLNLNIIKLARELQ